MQLLTFPNITILFFLSSRGKFVPFPYHVLMPSLLLPNYGPLSLPKLLLLLLLTTSRLTGDDEIYMGDFMVNDFD